MKAESVDSCHEVVKSLLWTLFALCMTPFCTLIGVSLALYSWDCKYWSWIWPTWTWQSSWGSERVCQALQLNCTFQLMLWPESISSCRCDREYCFQTSLFLLLVISCHWLNLPYPFPPCLTTMSSLKLLAKTLIPQQKLFLMTSSLSFLKLLVFCIAHFRAHAVSANFLNLSWPSACKGETLECGGLHLVPCCEECSPM